MLSPRRLFDSVFYNYTPGIHFSPYGRGGLSRWRTSNGSEANPQTPTSGQAEDPTVIRYSPPVNYKPWKHVVFPSCERRSAVLKDSFQLIINFPSVTSAYNDDDSIVETVVVETSKTQDFWIHQGFAPRPTNRWQAFRFHFGSGITMGYPFFSVLVFSIYRFFDFKPIKKFYLEEQ